MNSYTIKNCLREWKPLYKMPLYAGFDIGIRNLAFCVIDSDRWRLYTAGEANDPGVILWKNINVVREEQVCTAVLRSGKNKGSQCGKKACWVEKTTGEYKCGTHGNAAVCKKYKTPLIRNMNMRDLKKAAFTELDRFAVFNEVRVIAIESQPRKNQQMKMFGASIEAYFIIRQLIDNPEPTLRTIKASPAKNKLHMYEGPPISTAHIKDPYDRRKYLAQKQTEWFLRRSPETLTEYTASKKKDDLADAFLHCILAIKHR